jgi:glutathione S-transferase
MSDEIILHHYPSSPFGEMVRRALGLKGLAWRSVEQPNMLPRPELMAMTGGYRRIPVLQSGADIYCDSQMILRALDALRPAAPLTPPGQAGIAWALRVWAERPFFQACVGIIFGTLGEFVPKAFIADREQLSGRPFDIAAMQAAAPMLKDQWRANALWIEDQLRAGGPWLMGASPGLADIAASMPIWFLKTGLNAEFERLTSDMPHLRAWEDRIVAWGHGAATPMSAAEALDVARAHEPRPALMEVVGEPQAFGPGYRISVMADDYGRDKISGHVHYSTPQEIAVLRTDTPCGRVCVHFPRAGFLVEVPS